MIDTDRTMVRRELTLNSVNISSFTYSFVISFEQLMAAVAVEMHSQMHLKTR